MEEGKHYKKIVNSWCMYDWANSAFACTIMGAVYPIFYRHQALAAGMAENDATAYWGYTASIALLLIAVVAPVLGAISDYTGGKKRFLVFFAGLGILSTAAMVLLGKDTWLFASLLFIGGNLGFAGANIFYESMLPHIAGKNNIDQISAKGYAMGYVGGGVLLFINILWIMKPHWFGIPNADFATRASFFSVAVWWGVFTIPLVRNVPEPPAAVGSGEAVNPVSHGFRRLLGTFREITRYKQLLLFLAAFWIYNDGVGTIIKMATAYGHEIGIETGSLIAALLLTQFVGIPFTFLFGWLASKIGVKQSIMITLVMYTCICIGGYFMATALHFYLLAFLVGTVQGGVQALSRSVYGRMVPKNKSAEFYGFYSTSAKFAGIAGPLIFGLVSQLTGASRLSIVALVIFFIIGGILLFFVKIEEGERVARAAEAEAGVA